ncbi:hypothetical protein MJO28_015076 [Puccinia striiformis f. sp. tritici]|uniref:PLD phosphodiesterase domain-containing protein n=2 Tax=Puccinia striiformis TaxID=27350 RepID=A0A2S4WJT1_9BASI|nr:hypothetical protein MJO28_015076 [Puccinia striiformis f. sp. tritici]POW21998.1 hypothetical protein PSHT_01743 [Puccinia striiformis]
MGAEEVRPELPGLGKVSDTWSPPAADNYPSKLLVHTRDENGEGGNVPQQVPSGHAAGKRINLNSASVTSVLALYPNQSPQKIARILFPTPSLLKRIRQKFILSKDLFNREEPSAHRIQLAYQSGRWSTHEGSNVRPSELFLKMFSDVLLCLDRDRLSGFVSPSLIATCGVMPLTILSTISDIMRHYYECVVQAKHEVLVSTFYFWKSEAQLTFSRALFELSKRVEARQQKGKVVIKFIYNHRKWKQIYKNRIYLKPDGPEWKRLGLPDTKDIPNLELEVINFHKGLLGTSHSKVLIVDRNIALLNSNNIQGRPFLEMMTHLEGPIVDSFYDMFLMSWGNRMNPPLPLLTRRPSSQPRQYRFGSNNAFLRNIHVVQYTQDARATAPREVKNDVSVGADRHPDGILNSVITTVCTDPEEERRESRDQHNPEPSGIRFPRVKRGMKDLTDALNVGTIRPVDANVPVDHVTSDFKSHFIHEEHAEFPIVMVNRPPHGLPGNNDIWVPQNAAWIAGFKYAQKKVFIQTPNLNSYAAVKMCIETARRGVSVILYLGLGFNDDRQFFQGGTNQQVVIKMYKTLKNFNCQHNLRVFWYTAKDQIRPIPQYIGSRNCHIKFMVIDDSVGIIGSGNHDTQSWFHSQETNVMIDSAQIVRDWMKGVISNQNTGLYGRVDTDGIWRDAEGHVANYDDGLKRSKHQTLRALQELKNLCVS